jgi:manganese/zinc/iron transport system permease protein
MTITQIEIQLIAMVVAVACALPGVFLVLRRMAMMSDAISHTVLLGIVLSFFILRTLDSPLLIFGAAIMGVLTVSLVELVNNTRLVKQDAAIGIVFPALFSIAVILISRYASGVHLDSDAVLLGEIAFAPFDRANFLGLDVPHALVTMGTILVVNIVFIAFFYKELKLSTFDAGLAASLGFSPALIHYGLMGLVSVTAVGAFDAVGSILVVALMIAPAAAAYLLTDKLGRMLWLSGLIAAVSAVSGYWMARALDANIAGSMATTTGLIFTLVFLFAPQRGIVAVASTRRRQRRDFAVAALVIHLLNHEDTQDEAIESELEHLQAHLRWDADMAGRIVRRSEEHGLIQIAGAQLKLTPDGRELARATLSNR